MKCRQLNIKVKHLLLLPIRTKEPIVMSGYCSLYASHVQNQLLSNEADIICPPVLELFIRRLPSAMYHLILSELIC